MEVKAFSSEVGDSGVEFGNFTFDSTSEGGEGLTSLSFSFSFNGERGFKVLLDIIEDSKNGVNHIRVGNNWGSFSDHGNDVEDLSISMGDSLFSKRFERSDVSAQFAKGRGLNFEESILTTFEGFDDDLSGLVHHASNGVMFFNNTSKDVLKESIFFVHGGEVISSGFKFAFSVSFLGGSVFEDWTVNHDESLILGDNGFKGVGFSVTGIEVGSAGIGNDFVCGGVLFLFISELFSDFFDHSDDFSNIVFGLELEFNGLGKGGTKICFSDFSEEVL